MNIRIIINPKAFQKQIVVAECLGIPLEDLTLGLMMDLVQISKAIMKGDTKAYLAVIKSAGLIGGNNRPPDELEYFEMNGNRIPLDGKPFFKEGDKIICHLDLSKSI